MNNMTLLFNKCYKMTYYYTFLCIFVPKKS